MGRKWKPRKPNSGLVSLFFYWSIKLIFDWRSQRRDIAGWVLDTICSLTVWFSNYSTLKIKSLCWSKQTVRCWLNTQTLERDLRCVPLGPMLWIWDLCTCKRSNEFGCVGSLLRMSVKQEAMRVLGEESERVIGWVIWVLLIGEKEKDGTNTGKAVWH